MRERMSNVRSTIRRETDIVRDLVGDVRERFGRDLDTEPRSTRGLGGSLGNRGSLVKTIPHAVVRTVDNAVGHVQRFARINRLRLG